METKANSLYVTGIKITLTVIFATILFVIGSMRVNASSLHRYYFTYTNGNIKYDLVLENSHTANITDKSVVIVNEISNGGQLSDLGYQLSSNSSFAFYALNSDGSGVSSIKPRILIEYALTDGEWVIKNDYRGEKVYPEYTGTVKYGNGAVPDFTGVGVDILKINMSDFDYTVDAAGKYVVTSKTHSLTDNLLNYFLYGTFCDVPKNKPYVFRKYSNSENFVPSNLYYSYGASVRSNADFSLIGFNFEDGIASWTGFVCNDDDVAYKGVVCYLGYYASGFQQYVAYDTVLSTSGTYKLNLGNSVLSDSGTPKQYTNVVFQPFYVSKDGCLYSGKTTYASIPSDAEWTSRTSAYLLDKVGVGGSMGGVKPENGDKENIDVDTMPNVPTKFYLSNVSVKMNVLSNYVISWSGTKPIVNVPDADTVVLVTYIGYTGVNGEKMNVYEYPYFSASMDYNGISINNLTIGTGKVTIDAGKLLEYCTREGIIWDNEIWLTPCYKLNDKVYVGEPTVVNLYDYTIVDKVDNGDGTVSDVIPNDSVSSGNGGSGGSGSNGVIPSFSLDNVGDYINFAFDFLYSCLVSFGQFPALLSAVFCFLPSFYLNAIGVLLIVIFILRVLGR